MTVEAAVLAPGQVVRAGTGHLIAATVFILTAAALVPLFSVKMPAMIDYPNHLARVFLLVNLPHDALLQRFYDYVWQPIPDLGIDLLGPPLTKMFGIFLAGKLFAALALLTIAGGVFALHYALYREISAVPLLVFLFLYNWAFLYGFLNCLLGIGFALWAVAGWAWLRQASPWRRGLVSAGWIVVLYFTHLYGLCLYGLAILCWEGAELRRHKLRLDGRLVADIAVFALPFLPALALLALSPTGGSAHEIHYDRGVVEKASHAVHFLFYEYYSAGAALLLIAAMLAGAIWAIAHRRLSARPGALVFLAVGALLWAAMPNRLLTSDFVDDRLAVAVMMMLAGMIRCRLGPKETLILCAVISLFAAERYVEVGVAWHRHQAIVAEVETSLVQIEPGSRILTARIDTPTDAAGGMWAMIHLPELGIIERSSLVTLEFTNPSGQNLRLRPPYDESAPPQGIPPLMTKVVTETPDLTAQPPERYWLGWRSKYDYIYVLGAGRGTPAFSRDLGLVYQGDHLQLLQVIPSRRGS